eukprot:TRINITY_DN76797_c0_g1_i1.p1 TRINITY_DN76797_c0_g1~~TRINITY_DN76797_c0_g1_i1.p1  ORF type:complete len:293 (-),score=37.60 TRINITY_DN76797_c0_g1_i1:181-1059(-)
MSSRKKVAICQLRAVPNNVRANVDIMMNWMERAKAEGADLACFPELFLSDYDLERVATLSEASDGPSAQSIKAAARRLGISVTYGYSEEVKALHTAEAGVKNAACMGEAPTTTYYNSMLFIGRDGETLANFRKVHVWHTEAKHYRAGDKSVVIDWEGLKVGLAICADICMNEFVTSMVADKGAQVIVVLNALPDPPLYEKTPLILVPARALENRVYVVYADFGHEEKYSGLSRIFNPMAECLAAAKPRQEDLITAEICGNPDFPFSYHSVRRPEVYKDGGGDQPWKKPRTVE